MYALWQEHQQLMRHDKIHPTQDLYFKRITMNHVTTKNGSFVLLLQLFTLELTSEVH